jgi:uncharacterized protein
MDDHSTPQTVKDPQEMIAGMSPVMQPGLFVFCSILYNADSREAMAQAHGMIIEDEGMSLILPRAEAVRLGLAFDQPLKRITLMVYSALDGVGLTAAVATALAKHNIPANVVAGTMHDHIFVPSRQADAAIEVLRALQKEAQAKLR